MFKAGGRLFVDVTLQLASPVSRNILLNAMGQHDPLMKDALMNIIERGDFIKSLPNDSKEPRPNRGNIDMLGFHTNRKRSDNRF